MLGRGQLNAEVGYWRNIPITLIGRVPLPSVLLVLPGSGDSVESAIIRFPDRFLRQIVEAILRVTCHEIHRVKEVVEKVDVLVVHNCNGKLPRVVDDCSGELSLRLFQPRFEGELCGLWM